MAIAETTMTYEYKALFLDPFALGVHVRILPCDGRHFEWQKCIAVIERNVLIVSLFANASDYFNKTCIYRSMCLYLTNIQVLLE